MMRLEVAELMVAIGEPEELAKFASLFLYCVGCVEDGKKREAAKKEAQAIAKALNITFEEMINQERDEEE